MPKLTHFWRTCILPEVLGKWYTRNHFSQPSSLPKADRVCYCRKSTDEDCVVCCNPNCPIITFHLSCLKIESIPKTWYCPHCRTLPQYKRTRKATKNSSSVPHSAMSLDSICICKSRPHDSEKLLQCPNESCDNGNFFHLICLKYKKMPNNSQTTWVCPPCKKKVNSSKLRHGSPLKKCHFKIKWRHSKKLQPNFIRLGQLNPSDMRNALLKYHVTLSRDK